MGVHSNTTDNGFVEAALKAALHSSGYTYRMIGDYDLQLTNPKSPGAPWLFRLHLRDRLPGDGRDILLNGTITYDRQNKHATVRTVLGGVDHQFSGWVNDAGELQVTRQRPSAA